MSDTDQAVHDLAQAVRSLVAELAENTKLLRQIVQALPAASAKAQAKKRARGAPADGYSAIFEEFWNIWPRKVGKPAAYAVWRRVVPNDDVGAEICYAAEEWAAWYDQEGTELRMIPHPRTWLNQHRFNDDPTGEKAGH